MGELISIAGNKPLVKAEVVAEHLGVCEATILRMARKGKIPARSIKNGTRVLWRFSLDEVMHALEGGAGAA